MCRETVIEITITPAKYIGYNGVIDDSSILKFKVNEIVAKEMRGKSVLDAYAGIGHGTKTYIQYAEHVHAIEMNKDCYAILKRQMDYTRDVTLTFGDNCEVMKHLIAGGVKFDCIDLDAFQNVIRQLPLAIKLIDRGILTITTGEIFGMFRHRFKPNRHPYWVTEEELKHYGLNETFWKFPKEIIYPRFIEHELKKAGKQYELIYEFHHNLASKFVLSIGGYKFSDENLRKLNSFPTYIGWITKYCGKNESLEKWLK